MSATETLLQRTSNVQRPAEGDGGFGMLAIDLDGTLLRSNKQLSRKTAAAVNGAVKQGVRVVLASARPPRSVQQVYDRLKLDTYQINYNGALIYDPSNNRHVFHQPLDPALAGRIIRLARRIDPMVIVSLEILDKWYTDRVDHKLLTETAKVHSPDFIGPLDAFLTVPVTKLMLLAPPARIHKLREQLRKKFAREVAILMSDNHLIQIVHPEVDKAAALNWIAQKYGITQERVMAIGDAPNDTGMLRWAGLGVAMENAWPQTRKVADVVVPSNDDDGVAHAIDQYVMN